jgi:hypothetical protein
MSILLLLVYHEYQMKNSGEYLVSRLMKVSKI